MNLLHFPNFEHFSAALGAFAFDAVAAVGHFCCFGICHFGCVFTFHAISRYRYHG